MVTPAQAPGITWRWLGRAAFREVYAEQVATRERVWAGAPGIVFLCEHRR